MNKEERSNIALPPKMIKSIGHRKFQLGLSKVNSGMNAVTNSMKKQESNTAKRGLGLMPGQKEKSLETDTKEIKKSIGITENAINMIDKILEESNIPKNIVNQEFAILEQLLQESKAFILHENNSSSSHIGSAPSAGGRIYQEPRQRYTVNDLNRNIRKKIELDEKQTKDAQKIASKIEPGTEMTARENVIGITQGATNKYSAGRLLGAQNRARYLDLKEKEMQQEAGREQGGN